MLFSCAAPHSHAAGKARTPSRPAGSIEPMAADCDYPPACATACRPAPAALSSAPGASAAAAQTDSTDSMERLTECIRMGGQGKYFESIRDDKMDGRRLAGVFRLFFTLLYIAASIVYLSKYAKEVEGRKFPSVGSAARAFFTLRYMRDLLVIIAIYSAILVAMKRLCR